MEQDNTFNNWVSNLESELKSSRTLDFNFNDKNVLRVMKDDFISLFNDIQKGKSFKLCKLDTFTSLNQAISSYQKDNKLIGNELFSNKNKDEQQQILKDLYEEYNSNLNRTSTTNLYLTFGTVRYNLEPFSDAYKIAPLLFIPLSISYDEEKDMYFIKGIPGEVYTNSLLFSRIKKVRRLDLSYPVNSNFSISEFLYYVSIKLQALNWNVSNNLYISTFDLSKYDSYLEIKDKKEPILNQTIVKKISYFNSQFYHFNERTTKQLDSRFLSILEMNNDEYEIIKKLIAKENLFIRTSDINSKMHLLSNIILAYLMNNSKVLLAYSNYQEKERLVEYIEEQGYSKYVCDLNPLTLNKENLLAELVDYDKYLLPYNKTKNIIFKDELQNYYNYKNNYKKLSNSLRTTFNPIRISTNKLVNEYYKLDKYPLIDITIADTDHIDNKEIGRRLEIVNSFSDSIINLQCKIVDHPFYGFNRKIMRKDDYNDLKETAIKLTTIINDIKTILFVGEKKYSYPVANTLFEIKALLNVLSFIDEYHAKVEWIDMPDLSNTFNELQNIREDIESLNKVKANLVNKYTRKIQFLTEDIVKECVNNNSKTKSKARKLLGQKTSAQEFNDIISALSDYYKLVDKNKERCASIDETMVKMMRENRLDELNAIIRQILLYRSSIKHLTNLNSFDIHSIIQNKNENRLITRKALQSAYNDLLEKTNNLQSYFDVGRFDFKNLSLDSFYNKVDAISQNFSSINDYTNFYKSLLTTNNFIDNLGDELLKAGNPDDFKQIFLKRYYHDLLKERFFNNPILKNNNQLAIQEQLEKFVSSDTKRKDMINDIISNYIDRYLKLNILELKKNESNSIYQNFKNGMNIIPMNLISNSSKVSLYNFKPCIMVSYKDIAKYLKDPLFKYDCVIFLSSKEMSIIDALPSLSHSSTTIVFDDEFLSNDPRKSISINSNDLDDNFIRNAMNSYSICTYANDSHNIVFQNSPLDSYTKLHVANVLKNHGFEVKIDYSIKSYTFDLLAKIPNTPNIVVIEFNHLPYNSPEDAYNSLNLENKIITSLGFTPYHIFTANYFNNEENENKLLIEFITKNSNIISNRKVKKEEVLLMDHLFVEFIDPRFTYFNIDKTNKSPHDVVVEMIDECAPISVKELSIIVKENIKPIIKELEEEKTIVISDGFITKPNKPIYFRRVNRNESFYRPIKTVYKKEIFDAIYKVLKELSSIKQDMIIKMILLSLGYKKMNKENYEYVLSCIEFLISEKIIFINGDTLYRDIS